MLKPASDRRVAERKSLRVDAVVTLPGDQRFTVRTIDISREGVGIVAGANPSPGTRFVIEFPLPLRSRSAMPLRVSTRVAHSVFSSSEGAFKIGLAFIDLPAQAAQAIAEFMG